MKVKKLLIAVLTFALIFAFAVTPMTASAEKLYIKYPFLYGEEIQHDYYVDTDIPDTLFIEGKGRMYDIQLVYNYESANNDNFLKYNSALYNDALESEQKNKKYFFDQPNVVIGDGITYIGENVFTFFDRLERIFIPDSVTEMADNIILPSNVGLKCMMSYNNDPSKITICCSKDSYAYKYAVEKGFKVDTHTPVPPITTSIGDANKDGKLTAADALVIRRHISGQDVEISADNADVDKNGKVTTSDALMIRKKVAGQLLYPWDYVK